LEVYVKRQPPAEAFSSTYVFIAEGRVLLDKATVERVGSPDARVAELSFAGRVGLLVVVDADADCGAARLRATFGPCARMGLRGRPWALPHDVWPCHGSRRQPAILRPKSGWLIT
jgi:hypothetical protein